MQLRLKKPESRLLCGTEVCWVIVRQSLPCSKKKIWSIRKKFVPLHRRLDRRQDIIVKTLNGVLSAALRIWKIRNHPHGKAKSTSMFAYNYIFVRIKRGRLAMHILG